MNKRISKLVKKAGFHVSGDSICIPTIDEDITEIQAKFIELIVKECANIAYDAENSQDAGDNILEKFGLDYISD